MQQQPHFKMKPRQLALEMQFNDNATWTNFCWHGNELLQNALRATLNDKGERFTYIWGQSGCGKSHVLQACCQELNKQGHAIYLPLTLLSEWGPCVLDDLDDQELICIDDINNIARDRPWEEALFHLYNRIRDNDRSKLIISGNHIPSKLDLHLPDLTSRLSWGLVMPIQELNEHDKIMTLKERASKRGFTLSDGVIQFLLNRCARNMHDLLLLLDKLDKASLIAKRKITIPFVKEILKI